MMLNSSSRLTQMWTAVQEPFTPAYVPNSYLLLLSALKDGWLVNHVELVPSWDQHGFIYLVTLRHHQPDFAQRLVLPQNALIEELLTELKVF